MRVALIACLLLVAGCTSTWERHEAALAAHERTGNYGAAAEEADWLVENSFRHAPAKERTREAEGRRLLHLARLQARAGDPEAAVVSLRKALMEDPGCAAAVRAQVAELPLGKSELKRVQEEFSWNLAALAPQENLPEKAASAAEDCWSYGAREVRVRQQYTVTRGGHAEHRVRYDARAWQFDADSRHWEPAGAWLPDAGMEVERAGGPPQPRYRALVRAPRQFYVDGSVPPCHRNAWQGPYDTEADRVFVTQKLPGG